MFNFLKRLFGKSASSKAASALEDQLSYDDYGFDFSDVDEVYVKTVDYRVSREPVKTVQITDERIIQQLNDFLSVLPTTGSIMKKMAPGTVYTVFGCKEGKPTVYFDVYETDIKAPDTAFFGGESEEVAKAEQQIVKLIS